MFSIRRVYGRSMKPTLHSGDTVLFGRLGLLREGSVVLARVQGREVVKRISHVGGSHVRLAGDNPSESTDSRHYGSVNKSDILGSMMIKFPSAVNPPKLSHPQGLWLGRIAAAVLVVMVLVHLFRIDTFIPILKEVLQVGDGLATTAAIVIVMSELFALPFLLRIKLSPLAHIVSGALVALAPLWWLLVTIWAYDLNLNTGQLGQFVHVPATLGLVFFNLFWVSYNYYTLYALGYNKLNLSKELGRGKTSRK